MTTRTPRVSLSIDRSASVPLRFDDQAFRDAIEADIGIQADAEKGIVARPLAKLLGVQDAASFDFEGFIADEYTINACPEVLGKAEDDLYTAGQRQGGGLDVGAFNAGRWALWVQSVTVPDEVKEVMSRKDRTTLDMLSSPNKKNRIDGFDLLPRKARDAFQARLRVHTDEVDRDPDTDPDKTVDFPDAR